MALPLYRDLETSLVPKTLYSAEKGPPLVKVSDRSSGLLLVGLEPTEVTAYD